MINYFGIDTLIKSLKKLPQEYELLGKFAISLIETLWSLSTKLLILILTIPVKYGIPWVSDFPAGFKNFKIELQG